MSEFLALPFEALVLVWRGLGSRMLVYAVALLGLTALLCWALDLARGRFPALAKAARAWPWVLLGVFVVLQLVFLFKQSGEAPSRYLGYLREHGWAFVSVSNFKPLMMDLYYWVGASLFSDGFIAAHSPFLWLSALFNTAGLALLYCALRARGVPAAAVAVLLFVYGLYVIGFAIYRYGIHADALVLFFVALFFYSLLRLWDTRRPRDFFLTGVATALLIWQSSIYLLLGPVLLGALAFCLWLEEKWGPRAAVMRLAALGVAPVLAVAINVSKNWYYTGLKGTSILGGPCLMLVVEQMFGQDQARVREALVGAQVPAWYLSCFDERVLPVDPATGQPYPGWEMNSVAYGICYPFAGEAGEHWPFDFTPLQARLEAQGEHALARVVAVDVENARHHRHLFNPNMPEGSSRWLVHHATESIALAKKIFSTHPALFVDTFHSLHGLFWGSGPGYIRNENAFKIESRLVKKAVKAALRLIEPAFRYAYFTSWLIAICGWPFLLFRRTRAWALALWFAAAPAVLAGTVFNVFSGAENHRYYLQISPYLVATLGLQLGVALTVMRALATKLHRR